MSSLKPCPYAEKCYRRNPIHFGEYSHHHCKFSFYKINIENNLYKLMEV